MTRKRPKKTQNKTLPHQAQHPATKRPQQAQQPATKRPPASPPTEDVGPPPKRKSKRRRATMIFLEIVMVNFIVAFVILFALVVPLPSESLNEARLEWIGKISSTASYYHPTAETGISAHEIASHLYERLPSSPMSDGSESESFANAFNDLRPGVIAKKDGVRMKYPVVIFPGFTSVALKLWEGHPCADGHFRERLWNTMEIVRQFLTNKKCWLQHLALNETTGLDPDGIRVRALPGLEAIDYWGFKGYFVWAPVIQALADIGGDPSTIESISYDWRLHPTLMEQRDGHMTQAMHMIEASYERNKAKVVIMGHSYGSVVAKYFIRWVESKNGGNRGSGWCDKYIQSFVNIAGPMLGLPKAVTALLSGEFRDTTEFESIFGSMGVQLSQVVLDTKSRVDLFRTWSSLISMLPSGGEALWGSHDIPAVDQQAYNLTTEQANMGYILAHHAEDKIINPDAPLFKLAQGVGCGPGTQRNCTISQAIDLVKRVSGENFARLTDSLQSLGGDTSDLNNDNPAKWANSVETGLPDAPNMKIYCMYGTNHPNSERAYFMNVNKLPGYITIDYSKNDDGATGGVFNGPGDMTVPVVSLGAVCQGLWQDKRYNPSGIQVTTIEHDKNALGILSAGDIQGGGQSGAHVDILGNVNLLDDLISIVAGEDQRPPPAAVVSQVTQTIGDNTVQQLLGKEAA